MQTKTIIRQGVYDMKKEKMHLLYQSLKETYTVEHLISEHKKYLFVLESPHIDELVQGAPVSGLSGKAMSRVLLPGADKTAIGIQLKEKPEHSIGILNICTIPMQRTAYMHEKVTTSYGGFDIEKYADFFDILEKLRTETKTSYKAAERNDLQEMILHDFVHTLHSLENQDILLIPCGKTAEMFMKAANLDTDVWRILTGVPHPSFGNWHKSRYAEKIKEVKNAIEKTD